MSETKNSILKQTIPVGVICALVGWGASFLSGYVSGAEEDASTMTTLQMDVKILTKTVEEYIEKYNAERFVNLERDVRENEEDIAGIKEDIKGILSSSRTRW